MNLRPLSVGEHHHYKRNPYYIFAPPYNEKSSGIRVLHYLCNILNISGYEAYITTPSANPTLWTPSFSNDVVTRHFIAKKKPIVIYPEVVAGTPLGIGVPVRLLLNHAGKIAGHANFNSNEIEISYRSAFSSNSETPLLTIPCSDPEVFHPPSPGTPREGRYFYFNRLLSRGGELQEITNGAIEISSRNPVPLENLPDLFRKAELLYCYEDGAITLEARMCGCPIAYIPNPTMLPDFPSEDWGNMGAAWGTSPEQIGHAKQTVHQVYPAALALYEKFHEQLAHFVDLTQSAANIASMEDCYASQLRPTPRNNQQEQAWLKAHEMEEADGQIWAERMLSTWSHQPFFHFFLKVTRETQSKLADTLEHFSNLLYPRWQVTVVTDLPMPDGWSTSPPFQWLSLRNIEDSDYVLNEMASASTCDWIAEIQPGVELRPYALLMAGDYINHNPHWLLFDADEFGSNSPKDEPFLRLNTGFDLAFLREYNYLGDWVMVRQDAFVSAGKFGIYPQARPYELTLKIHDHFGKNAIGHIPHILSNRPARIFDNHALTHEELALKDHFNRIGINAEIQQGATPHSRMVFIKPETFKKTTFVILIENKIELNHPTLTTFKQHAESDLLLIDISGKKLSLPQALVQCARLIESTRAQWPQDAILHANSQLLLFLPPYTTAPTPREVKLFQEIMECTQTAAVVPAILNFNSNVPANLNEWPSQPIHANPIKQFCTHSKFAISSFPFCVKKEVLTQNDGLNLNHCTLADGLIGFSAHIITSGLNIAWTPHITLQQRHPAATPENIDPEFTHQSRENLIRENIQYLTKSTEIHENLIFQNPKNIKHHHPLTWNTHANERPRILVIDGSKDATDPFMNWVDRLSNNAEAIVLKIASTDASTDVLAVSRIAPHIIIFQASPDQNTQMLMRHVKVILPHVVIAVNLGKLDFVSDDEKSCAEYLELVLEACTAHADQLITFGSSESSTHIRLSRMIDRLTPDASMPETWAVKPGEPITA